MRSSWPMRSKRLPRVNLAIGGILIAFGLWDLFFVLFRSEDVFFMVSAVLLLLFGTFNIWLALIFHPG